MLAAMSTASSESRPPRLADEHVGFNGRLAAAMTKAVGTMWVVDAEAILHECRQLQRHLTAQDQVIVKIAEYIERHEVKPS